MLRDRQHLGQDGIVIVVLAMEGATNQVIAGPDIQSRGFVYVREADELMEGARMIVDDAVKNCLDRRIRDWGRIKGSIRDSLGDYLWKKTKRRPMILPIIIEV